MLLPFQIAFWLYGGTRRADAPPVWVVLLVLAVGLGLVGGGLYWLFGPRSATEQTRQRCDELAAGWKKTLERDGLPEWKNRRLDERDAWVRPLLLEVDRALHWTRGRVTSAGTDGQADTGDDVTASRTVSLTAQRQADAPAGQPDGLKKRLGDWAIRKAGDLLEGGKDAKDAPTGRP